MADSKILKATTDERSGNLVAEFVDVESSSSIDALLTRVTELSETVSDLTARVEALESKEESET